MVKTTEVMLHQWCVCSESSRWWSTRGVSSHGYGDGRAAVSVVVVAVRVWVGVAVVVAISSLCFGLQRFWLKGQRFDDSTRLLHHLHLSGVGGGGGVIHQRGAAGKTWRFGRSTGLVCGEAGWRFRTGLVGWERRRRFRTRLIGDLRGTDQYWC